MAEAVTKLPVKTEQQSTMPAQMWQSFGGLRREVDRLFDEIDGIRSRMPFSRSLFDYPPFARSHAKGPAVDVVENDKEFEITAELPGLDEKDVEVKIASGGLTIRGEKSEGKEERNKNYYVSERRYGSFERLFALPEGVDADKISASFKKGVLTVTLPKTIEAQKQEKKIAIKAD